MYEEKVAPFGVFCFDWKKGAFICGNGYWKGMLWGMEVYYFAPCLFIVRNARSFYF
jgi:hypothetical protein